MVKPSPESLQAAKQATARILARRCKDGESADVAIILSVGAEMVHGTYVVLKDIKETENRILAALARKGSK